MAVPCVVSEWAVLGSSGAPTCSDGVPEVMSGAILGPTGYKATKETLGFGRYRSMGLYLNRGTSQPMEFCGFATYRRFVLNLTGTPQMYIYYIYNPTNGFSLVLLLPEVFRCFSIPMHAQFRIAKYIIGHEAGERAFHSKTWSSFGSPFFSRDLSGFFVGQHSNWS